jgi:DNA helicase-2/ATP-dependent DNA helicase PcrA
MPRWSLERLIIADGESSGRSYFATWLHEARKQAIDSPQATLLELVGALATDPSSARNVIDRLVAEFERIQADLAVGCDLAEDLAAWREISRDIARHIGRAAPPDQFLQELQLRSKEPSPKPGVVTLTTIHGAKGGEFDCDYVIGLAEDVMPSFQSRKKGDQSPEMEEERRNCFVAITRAKECLILSRAKSYLGWLKPPSRFLVEMGLIEQTQNR